MSSIKNRAREDKPHSKNSENSHTPALLTKTSSRPHFSTAACTSRTPVSCWLMSPGTSISRSSILISLLEANWVASENMLWNCSADLASPKWFTATRAPCAMYSSAIARPMPVTPPVMAQILPVRSWVVIVLHDVEFITREPRKWSVW